MRTSLFGILAIGSSVALLSACAGSEKELESPDVENAHAVYAAAGEAAQRAQENVARAEQMEQAEEAEPQREPVVGLERDIIIIQPQVEAPAAADEAAPMREPVRVMEGVTGYTRLSDQSQERDGAAFHSELTAASSDLPIGSIVRVVRTDTEDSLVLHVSQSNSAVPSQMLKLSSNAAARLGLNGYDVVPLRLEVLFEPQPAGTTEEPDEQPPEGSETQPQPPGMPSEQD